MSGESTRTMPVQEVPIGSTGTVLERTIVDDGSAVDLSGATGSVTYSAKTIGGTAIATDTAAAFTSDGSDGKVRFTLTSALVGAQGDKIITFKVGGYNSGDLITYPFILRPIYTGEGS